VYIYNSCLQCTGAQLLRKLAFIAFFHLYACITFALYLCTSLQLHWSILDNPTAHRTTQLSHNQAMPFLTLQKPNTLFTTDHHRTLQWGNMNWHCRYFKIHIKFVLQSLPQSPKQFCPFIFPAHNIMLFSFPHTLYCMSTSIKLLHCCFHLIRYEQQKLQTITFQAHTSAAKRPAQL
jgi:hypothetical protein